MKINFKKSSLFVFSFILLVGLFFSSSALAVDFGLQQVDATGLGHADIRIIIGNIIRVALGMLGIVAVGLVIYAGYLWMTSGGNEEQVATAKKILINATIGIAIILSAYSIVAFVMTKLVEATGFNGGTTLACQAQINSGGASCDGKCPACQPDCTAGTGCTQEQPFYIVQRPSGGDVCVMNYYPIIVFNKDVDLKTLNHVDDDGFADNIKVVDQSDGSVVKGSWSYQYGSLREVYFSSETQCLSNPNYFCLKSKTNYKVVVAKSSEIKTASGLQNLNCDGQYSCGDVAFHTGDSVDSNAPSIEILTPENGDTYSQSSTIGIDVRYFDDSGLQKLNLKVDNNFITSVSPAENCSKEGTITVNWNANYSTVGPHNLGLIGIDWANNKSEEKLGLNIKPGHCFNGLVDSNLDERFTSPAPTGDCGGECGACAADACDENSDCASGYCEIPQGAAIGTCGDKTKIDSFSLDNGAVGDFVSIFGKSFGSNPGKVYFSAADSLVQWIEATPVTCGSNFKYWTNNQIVVSVPAGIAASGPIKVETLQVGANGTDTTDDNWGPKSNFTLTNISHPGICGINPVSGYPGAPFSVSGKGFGSLFSLTNNDGLIFQGDKIIQSSWTETSATSYAPLGLGDGNFTVQVRKNGIYSNGVKFSVSGSDPNGPIISSLSVTSTAKGDYLTIYGKNFGKNAGSVVLNSLESQSGLGPDIAGDFNFPDECKKTVWKDDQVLVKIPDNVVVGKDFMVRVRLANNQTISTVDRKIFVSVVAGVAKPGICLISPSSGAVPFTGNNVVNIYGDNLDPVDAAYFWKTGGGNNNLGSLSSSTITKISNSHITTRPASSTASGPMFVRSAGGNSNSILFSVFNCVTSNNTCSDSVNEQCCAIGQQSGMCIPKDSSCIGAKRSTGYAWLFSTGGIVPIPQVVERCEAGQIPSPSPSTIWNTGGSSDASNVCRTAVSTVEFNTSLDQTTVNSSTVKLFKCSSINGNSCVDPQEVEDNIIDPDSYDLQISNSSNGNTRHYLNISLSNSRRWDADSWYQVRVGDSVKTSVYKDKNGNDIQFNLSATKSCGSGTAYCYSFRTSQDDCRLKEVIVTPGKFWTNVLEEPIRYHALGGSSYDITYSGNGLSTQRCIMMNVNGFDWTWSPVENTYIKRLSVFGENGRLAQFGSEANTVGIGLPGDGVEISATAATTTGNGVSLSKTGTSTLTIDLSNPRVVDFEPKCLETCTDALVSATFNVSMSDKNLSTAVKLFKCNDENCLSVSEVNGAAPTVESKTVGDRRWLKVYNNNSGQSLLPNTLYKVVLSTTSTSPNVNSTSQLWSLARAGVETSYSKPVNQEFSWRFRTKKDACSIDRVEIIPQIFTAQKLNDRAVFTAQPYSSPDNCSAVGQKINPFKTNWSWASSDLDVAEPITFVTKGRNPYCTADCLLTGSDIPSGVADSAQPVCGNDVIEAGEDCLAPDKSNNCSLNCLTIGKTKKGSQAITGSQDVNASVCGNGIVGVDEDCDLGISPSSTVSTSAMFCGASCLHLGTPLSSAWCKDHLVDKGGFSDSEYDQACALAFSRCGDGKDDYNEDAGCDLGNGNHHPTCNDSCLRLVRCLAGEEGCEDGQKQGSSLLYSEPSVCGDGVVGKGEDAQCDNVNNFAGTVRTTTDPWVLVIGQGGGVPTGTPPVQFSNITGTGGSKSGVGKYQVQCGWETDAECAGKYNDNNRGVGDDSCCYARSKLTGVFPGATTSVASNICINTYIQAEFDGVIDINTLPGNLLLAKYNSGDTCAPGTEMVSSSLIAEFNVGQNLAWYQKIWQKVLVTFKNIFGDNYAQANVWCAGSDLASPSVVPNGNGGSKVVLKLNQALSPNTRYAVVLKPSIKDSKGVHISSGSDSKPLNWSFTTGNKICEVSSVSVDPSSYSFTRANVSTTLEAVALSQNNQQIVPVPGYTWEYSWGPKVNDFVSLSDTTSSINNIVSQNRNGELDVFVSANITANNFTKQAGLVGTGRSHIIVFLCENPWPPLHHMVGQNGPFDIFPYEDKTGNNDNFSTSSNSFDNTPIAPSQVVSSGYFNFSSYYCADSGAAGNINDDLPYLKPAVQTNTSVLESGNSALKRFFFTNEKNSDAIGIQILSNPNHLSAREWFELDKNSGGQGFVSLAGLRDISVDGYDAVTDGNNIYVNALNFTSTSSNSGNLYTNTYLFSINPVAGDETRKVFEQFIKNLKFNLNLTNDKRCVVPGSGPDNDSQLCDTDFDCTGGEICSAQKNKLQRDFKRLQDMGEIFDLLDVYSQKNNGIYPDLKSGTYLTGQTVSAWPSWSVLGNAVGSALPIDPINKLGVSGTCGHSSASAGTFCNVDEDCASQVAEANRVCVLHDATGWSTENQRFSFACNTSSLAYRYTASSTSSTAPGAESYKMKMNWEIIGLNNQGLNILNKSGLFNDFVPPAEAAKFDFNSSLGICNQSDEIASLILGSCGDGKVGKNESCDPPGGVAWNLNACSANGATATTTLYGNICSNSCQWQNNATSTTCGAKLSKCGNGKVEIGETCDDGVLNGKYNQCNQTCTGLSGACGNGTVETDFEVCDIKANNTVGSCVGGVKHGQGCSTNNDCNEACIASPFDPFSLSSTCSNPNITSNGTGICKIVTQTFSKYGGKNKANSCYGDCQAYGPYCGDGKVDDKFGEECDGNQSCSIASAGAGQRVCSSDCRWINTAAVVNYKFDDVLVYNNRSYIANFASSTLISMGAYCSGNSCPSPVPSFEINKNKQAMKFDGTDDYFTIASSTRFNLGQLTLATWINVDQTSEAGKWYTIFAKQDVSKPLQPKRDYNFVFHTSSTGAVDSMGMSSRDWINNSNQKQIFGESGVDAAQGSVLFSGGQWHFVAVTMDASRKARYYLDGNLIGTRQAIGTTTVADGPYDIWIGLGDPGSVGGKYFKGMLDDVQLYGRALSDVEIKDLFSNSANFCQLSSVPNVAQQTQQADATCGNGIVDNGQNGTQNKGEVCDSGAQNGSTCTAGYGKSCTYCSGDCKNVITVSATGYCGDGVINGSEKCEVDSFGSLVSFATSSGTGNDFNLNRGLSTFNTLYHGGYKVLQCYDEFNTTLNASSSYWYNQFVNAPNFAVATVAAGNLIGKVGQKTCASSCGVGSNSPIQNSCVSCGLSADGTTVSGAIINVLDPGGKNPLIAEPGEVVQNGHIGFLNLLYPQKNSIANNNSAFAVAYDSYGFGSEVLTYKLRPQGGQPDAFATINSNPICSDTSQDRYYRMAFNADWSKEHLLDFPVFSSGQPEIYNLLLSPVIAQNSVDSQVDTVARPNDYRIVVSWVGKDVGQFSAGFLNPSSGTSYQPNNPNATGISYFNQTASSGVWFHGFGHNTNYNANVESFTINTDSMTTSSYPFYVKINSLNEKLAQAGKNAKLKVEIYAPEPKRAGEDNDVYRHFARPINTFYFTQAKASADPDSQYWHVFNFNKISNPVAEYSNHFYIGNQYNSIRKEIKLFYAQ